MPTNLTPSSVFAGEVTVPDEAEEVTAVAAGAGKGPVRPGFQMLFNKLWSLISGKVSVRAMLIQTTAGSAVNPADGNLQVEILVLCPNFLGDQASMQNYSEVRHLTAPIGTAQLRAGRLVWTGLTTGDAEGGNPARTAPIKNQLRPLNTPKAWFFGKIAAGGGAFELAGANAADGAGILGMSFPGGNMIQLTLAQSFDGLNYSVNVHANLGNDPLFPTVSRNAVNVILLDFTNADYRAAPGGAIDPGAAGGAGIEIHVQVYGRQT